MDTTIYLDFARETTPVVVFAKQNDRNRSLTIYPREHGLPIDTNGITAVSLRVTNAAGLQSESIGTLSGDEDPVITVNIPPASLMASGMAIADVALYVDTAIITSQLFYINVREAAVGGVS